jgi:hypothetical protein
MRAAQRHSRATISTICSRWSDAPHSADTTEGGWFFFCSSSAVTRPARSFSRAQRARARARAKHLSRLPGTNKSQKSWRKRSRSANEMQTHENRQNRAPAALHVARDAGRRAKPTGLALPPCTCRLTRRDRCRAPREADRASSPSLAPAASPAETDARYPGKADRVSSPLREPRSRHTTRPEPTRTKVLEDQIAISD